MSQHAAGQRAPRRVHELHGRGEPAASTEHPSERHTRLTELRRDGDHRRWKEKFELCASLAFLLVVCTVWAIVFLSGRFSPEDKQLATSLVVPVITAVGGYVAGTRRTSPVAAD